MDVMDINRETIRDESSTVILNSMEALLKVLGEDPEYNNLNNKYESSSLPDTDSMNDFNLALVPKEIKFRNRIGRELISDIRDMPYMITRIFFQRSPKGNIWLFNCYNLNMGNGISEVEAIEMLEEYMNCETIERYYNMIRDDLPVQLSWENAKWWYPLRGDCLCGNIFIKGIIPYGAIPGDYLVICDNN